MRTLQKAREELEQELKLRSARIERGVARLKTDISFPSATIGRLARNRPYESLLGIAAVGAAAAFLLTNRSRKKPRASSRNGSGIANAYADVISASIRAGEQGGLSSKEALHAAIRDNPPVVVPPQRDPHPTHLQRMADRLVNTVTAMAFEYASSRLDELLERRNGTR